MIALSKIKNPIMSVLLRSRDTFYTRPHLFHKECAFSLFFLQSAFICLGPESLSADEAFECAVWSWSVLWKQQAEVDIVYCAAGQHLPSSSLSDCSRCCEILTVKLQAYFAINTKKKYSLANKSILFSITEFFILINIIK